MALSIKEIENYLDNVDIINLRQELSSYYGDQRKGVQKLIRKYENNVIRHEKEVKKFYVMSQYEEKYRGLHYQYIVGVDEVGRGPLAGPVVSAAVQLPKEIILGIDDSKKLSEKKREELYDIITDKAIDFAVGIIDVNTIDEINILQATYLSMQSALDQLNQKPDVILVDAVTIPNVKTLQDSIISGDSKSISIAAASIIAKVTRDKMMEEYHELFPQYNFAKNKGYGTKEHQEAIKKYGLCPIHRKTFVTNLID